MTNDPTRTKFPRRPGKATAAQPARFQLSVKKAEGLRVRVSAQASQVVSLVAAREGPQGKPADRNKPALHAVHLGAILAGLALLVYLGTRLYGLVRFPIYFFCDEAAPGLLASDLIKGGFFGGDGDFLPTFFLNEATYRLGFTVYLHILPVLIFGKSVLATRLTAMLFTLLAAGAVGVILKEIFKITTWWSGILFLSTAPAWFLHSRTAFEYSTAVTLYALFLCFYLLYRYRNPRFLPLALVAGALCFYSYTPMQAVVLVSGLLLLFSDLDYHWQQRRTALGGLACLGILALPYLRFLIQHGGENTRILATLSSYWVGSLPLGQKIARYAAGYLAGLNPAYWFFPNNHELIRHVMKGYSHLPMATLPLAAAGLVWTLRRWRSPACRTLLAALLAAPTGAALVEVGVNRLLVMVIPAVLLSALGADALLSWVGTWINKLRPGWEQKKIQALPGILIVFWIALFATLTFDNIAMARDAVANGPTWFQDYGLYGMQYGAQNVFTVIQKQMQAHPQMPVIVSPSWTNGIVSLARFFLPYSVPGTVEGGLDGPVSPSLLYFANIHMFTQRRLPVDETALMVMTVEEYNEALPNPAIRIFSVEDIIPYPNGKPGFYLVHLRYNPPKKNSSPKGADATPRLPNVGLESREKGGQR